MDIKVNKCLYSIEYSPRGPDWLGIDRDSPRVWIDVGWMITLDVAI